MSRRQTLRDLARVAELTAIAACGRENAAKYQQQRRSTS